MTTETRPWLKLQKGTLNKIWRATFDLCSFQSDPSSSHFMPSTKAPGRGRVRRASGGSRNQVACRMEDERSGGKAVLIFIRPYAPGKSGHYVWLYARGRNLQNFFKFRTHVLLSSLFTPATSHPISSTPPTFIRHLGGGPKLVAPRNRFKTYWILWTKLREIAALYRKTLTQWIRW